MTETNRRAKRWDRLVKQNDIDREIYLRETKIKNDKFVQDIKEKHNNQILKKRLNELPKRQTTIAACDSMRDFEKLKAETK
jgi:hypothetical protein